MNSTIISSLLKLTFPFLNNTKLSIPSVEFIQNQNLLQKLQDSNQQTSQFKILSYNILAECFDPLPWYPQTKKTMQYFDFNYRKIQIINKIKHLNPEIICLQEVDNYENYYKQQLNNLQYQSFYQPKHGRKEGVLIGFKKDSFELIDTYVINFNDQDNDILEFAPRKYTKNNKFSKPIVAIFAELMCKKTKNIITVCTTHIYWDYKQSYIKYYQVCKILAYLSQKYKQNPNQNIIFTGDLNAISKCDITALLQKQLPPNYENIDERETHFVKQDHMQIQKRIFEFYTQNYGLLNIQYQDSYNLENIENNFGIDINKINYLKKQNQSISGQKIDNPFTIFTPIEQLNLDYIYFNKNSKNLQLLGVMKLRSIENIQSQEYLGIIPSQNEPSDHLPIMAKFVLQ